MNEKKQKLRMGGGGVYFPDFFQGDFCRGIFS